MSLSVRPVDVAIAAAVLPTIATTFLALRFYLRRLNRVKLGLDDWTIGVAIVFVWFLAVIMFVG